MILEFIGLPGSGKSTILNAATRKLDRLGVAWDSLRLLAKRVIEEDRQKIGFLRRREHRASLYGAQAFAQTEPEIYDALFVNARTDMKTTLWNMEMLAHVYFARRRDLSKSLIFTDEGFVHRGAASFLLSRNEVGFRDYMGRVPLDHTVIHVTTPLDIAYARSQTRKLKKRIPTGWIAEDQEGTLDNLSEFEHLSHVACRILRKRGGQVIKLDGTLPVETASEVLVQEIAALQRIDLAPRIAERSRVAG